mgnify:CR=1 FL=1
MLKFDITKKEVQEIANERIGRDLTDQELEELAYNLNEPIYEHIDFQLMQEIDVLK